MTPNRAHSETPKPKTYKVAKAMHIDTVQRREGETSHSVKILSNPQVSAEVSSCSLTQQNLGPKMSHYPVCNTQGVLYLKHLLGPSSFHDRIANPTELKTKLHVCITNFLTLAAKQERQWERKAERKKAGGREIILVLQQHPCMSCKTRQQNGGKEGFVLKSWLWWWWGWQGGGEKSWSGRLPGKNQGKQGRRKQMNQPSSHLDYLDYGLHIAIQEAINYNLTLLAYFTNIPF